MCESLPHEERFRIKILGCRRCGRKRDGPLNHHTGNGLRRGSERRLFEPQLARSAAAATSPPFSFYSLYTLSLKKGSVGAFLLKKTLAQSGQVKDDDVPAK